MQASTEPKNYHDRQVTEAQASANHVVEGEGDAFLVRKAYIANNSKAKLQLSRF
jgi:hypothetical protein